MALMENNIYFTQYHIVSEKLLKTNHLTDFVLNKNI